MPTATLTATFARLAASLETMANKLQALEAAVSRANDRIDHATRAADCVGAAAKVVGDALASPLAQEAPPAPTTPREEVVQAFRGSLPEEVVEEAPPAPLGVPAPTPAEAPALVITSTMPAGASLTNGVVPAEVTEGWPEPTGPLGVEEAPAKGKARSRKGGRR